MEGEGGVVLAHGVVHLTQPAHGQTLTPLISAFPKQKMFLKWVPVYLKNVAMWERMDLICCKDADYCLMKLVYRTLDYILQKFSTLFWPDSEPTKLLDPHPPQTKT